MERFISDVEKQTLEDLVQAICDECNRIVVSSGSEALPPEQIEQMDQALQGAMSQINPHLDSFPPALEANPRVKSLINHGTSDSLAPVSLICQKMLRFRDQLSSEEFERSRDAMRAYLWVVANDVGALDFWTEGRGVESNKRSLTNFMQVTRRSLESLFGEKMAVEVGIPVQPAKVSIHPPTVASLVRNMVVNARDRGGAQTVTVMHESGLGEESIVVRDDGSGIPPEHISRIYEWGYSGDEESTGLGLADAPRRMQAMGGEIFCEPHGGIDGGARFDLILKRKD